MRIPIRSPRDFLLDCHENEIGRSKFTLAFFAEWLPMLAMCKCQKDIPLGDLTILGRSRPKSGSPPNLTNGARRPLPGWHDARECASSHARELRTSVSIVIPANASKCFLTEVACDPSVHNIATWGISDPAPTLRAKYDRPTTNWRSA